MNIRVTVSPCIAFYRHPVVICGVTWRNRIWSPVGPIIYRLWISDQVEQGHQTARTQWDGGIVSESNHLILQYHFRPGLSLWLVYFLVISTCLPLRSHKTRVSFQLCTVHCIESNNFWYEGCCGHREWMGITYSQTYQVDLTNTLLTIINLRRAEIPVYNNR